MFSDLLEHVIVEANAGADIDGLLNVEIDIHANRRFACFSLYRRRAVAREQGGSHSLPTGFERSLGGDQESTKPQLVGELEVGQSVADNSTRTRVERYLD